MAQAQADRSAAAKKAAVTRQRNAEKAQAKVSGKKAASTQQQHDAKASLNHARSAVGDAVSSLTPDIGGAVSSLKSAVGHFGDALRSAGKAADTVSDAAEQEAKR